MFKGHHSPRFHDRNYSLVEKRVISKKLTKPLNEKLDTVPSFLRSRKATVNISPASHNPLESLKTACMPNKTFFSRKGNPKSHVD